MRMRLRSSSGGDHHAHAHAPYQESWNRRTTDASSKGEVVGADVGIASSTTSKSSTSNHHFRKLPPPIRGVRTGGLIFAKGKDYEIKRDVSHVDDTKGERVKLPNIRNVSGNE